MQRKMQLIRDISNDLKCKKRRIEQVFLGPKLGYDKYISNSLDGFLIRYCITKTKGGRF
jgi:hypothetical protein